VSLAGDMVTYTPRSAQAVSPNYFVYVVTDGKGGVGRGCGRGANRQLRCGTQGEPGVFRAKTLNIDIPVY